MFFVPSSHFLLSSGPTTFSLLSLLPIETLLVVFDIPKQIPL